MTTRKIARAGASTCRRSSAANSARVGPSASAASCDRSRGPAANEIARDAALDAWVFVDSEDPADPDNFRARIFDPLLVTAEVRKIRIHDLRHTFASLI